VNNADAVTQNVTVTVTHDTNPILGVPCTDHDVVMQAGNAWRMIRRRTKHADI